MYPLFSVVSRRVEPTTTTFPSGWVTLAPPVVEIRPVETGDVVTTPPDPNVGSSRPPDGVVRSSRASTRGRNAGREWARRGRVGRRRAARGRSQDSACMANLHQGCGLRGHGED